MRGRPETGFGHGKDHKDGQKGYGEATQADYQAEGQYCYHKYSYARPGYTANLDELRGPQENPAYLFFTDFVGNPGRKRPTYKGLANTPPKFSQDDYGEDWHEPFQNRAQPDHKYADNHREFAAISISYHPGWNFEDKNAHFKDSADQHQLQGIHTYRLDKIYGKSKEKGTFKK